MRNTTGYFTSKRLKVSAGLENKVSDETVRRVLRKANLRYLHSRKKGILTRKDLRERLKFAKKVRRRLDPNIWKEGISFYLDGVGFTHKMNPCDQARAPRTMAWRKPSDGLQFQFTAKGSHEGSGGSVAHFMVAIAYGKGVVLAEQYSGHLNGQICADFIRNKFPALFQRSGVNTKGKLFLQDGDPSQNSRKAQEAMHDVHARKFSIPARSPDLNPIENVFHNVKRKLHADALENNITREKFEKFSERVKRTLENYSSHTIDKTIDSMDKRISMIIKSKGQRIKY